MKKVFSLGPLIGSYDVSQVKPETSLGSTYLYVQIVLTWLPLKALTATKQFCLQIKIFKVTVIDKRH